MSIALTFIGTVAFIAVTLLLIFLIPALSPWLAALCGLVAAWIAVGVTTLLKRDL